MTDQDLKQIGDLLGTALAATEQRLEEKFTAGLAAVEQRLEDKFTAAITSAIAASEQRLEDKFTAAITSAIAAWIGTCGCDRVSPRSGIVSGSSSSTIISSTVFGAGTRMSTLCPFASMRSESSLLLKVDFGPFFLGMPARVRWSIVALLRLSSQPFPKYPLQSSHSFIEIIETFPTKSGRAWASFRNSTFGTP